jgi:hypothetical protein
VAAAKTRTKDSFYLAKLACRRLAWSFDTQFVWTRTSGDSHRDDGKRFVVRADEQLTVQFADGK